MKKNLLRAAAALAGLILGIVIFFPWDALAPALFAFAAREAASRGVYVTALVVGNLRPRSKKTSRIKA